MIYGYARCSTNESKQDINRQMANAKAKGKRVGRPPVKKEDIPAVFLKHYAAYTEGKMNVSELARVCGLSRPTVYKYMRLIK